MFQLDTNAASSVNGGGNRISESGIYSGEITKAEWSNSNSSQAEFLNIDFKSDDGREARFMSICYKKGNGEQSFGYNTMMALIACTKNRSVSAQDYNGKSVAPELMGKKVKLALQAEPDWFLDSDTGEYKPTTNMHIYVPFEYESGKSAKELLNKQDAQLINTLVVNDKKAKEKPVANQGQQQGGFTPQQQGGTAYSEPPIDFDDGIPFAPIGLQNPSILSCI